MITIQKLKKVNLTGLLIFSHTINVEKAILITDLIKDDFNLSTYTLKKAIFNSLLSQYQITLINLHLIYGLGFQTIYSFQLKRLIV